MISRIQQLILVGVGACLLGTHSISYGHQQKEAYITLLFNDRTSLVEISHRFSLHDAQHVVKSLLGSDGDLATDPAAQQLLVEYIYSHFSLSKGHQEPLPIKPIGHEVDSKYFWVYQELDPPNVDSLTVRDTALFETWPSQINYVNVEKSGWVRSARLSKDKPYKVISLIE